MVGLWCDLVLLSRQSLYAANFTALGFSPGMGATGRLPQLFGAWLAQELLLTGRSLTGAELARLCPALAPRVLPAEALEAAALALAEDIADADPAAVRVTTALLRRQQRAVLEVSLAIEEPAQAALLADPQTRERVRESYVARSPAEESG
jgi:enoyl-CoA hydratase/carnithine racemase